MTAGSLASFSSSAKFYETLYFSVLVTLPLLYVNFSSNGRWLEPGGDQVLYAASVVISISITIVWYKYLTWLDVFERERFKFIALVFLISCSSIFLV